MSEFKLQTARSLTQRPFAERQLLVVSMNAVLTAAEKIEAETSTKKTQGYDLMTPLICQTAPKT